MNRFIIFIYEDGDLEVVGDFELLEHAEVEMENELGVGRYGYIFDMVKGVVL